jgi:hypothetical protein
MPCFDQRLMKQDEHDAWTAYNVAKDRNPNDPDLQRLHDNAADISTRLREHLKVCTECNNVP